MVQVLDRIPSFGERFAEQFTKGLGSGLEKGFSTATELAKVRSDPYKELQQTRLAADSKYKQLSGFVREADSILKDPLYPFRPGEKEELKSQRDAVAQRRDQIFALGKELEEHAGKQEPSADVEPPTKKSKSKPKFMKSNKEHMAKFNQLVGTYGRDEKKIREILEKEFDLD